MGRRPIPEAIARGAIAGSLAGAALSVRGAALAFGSVARCARSLVVRSLSLPYRICDGLGSWLRRGVPSFRRNCFVFWWSGGGWRQPAGLPSLKTTIKVTHKNQKGRRAIAAYPSTQAGHTHLGAGTKPTNPPTARPHHPKRSTFDEMPHSRSGDETDLGQSGEGIGVRTRRQAQTNWRFVEHWQRSHGTDEPSEWPRDGLLPDRKAKPRTQPITNPIRERKRPHHKGASAASDRTKSKRSAANQKQAPQGRANRHQPR